MEKFRDASGVREIFEIFVNIFNNEEDVSLWQTIEGRRVLCDANIKMIDHKNKAIHFTPKNDSDGFSIKKKIPLYVTGAKHDFAFKLESFISSSNSLIIQIPKIVKIIEKRERNRIPIDFDRDMRCIFKSYGPYGEGKTTFDLRLIDISTGGLALLMDKGLLTSISAGDELVIVEINNIEISRPIRSKLLYIRDYSFKHNGSKVKEMRGGVQFGCEIDLE